MTIDTTEPYPGGLAAPGQICALAGEYRKAALTLQAQGRRGQPVSRAPFRLTAIHAIELYLNAFLLRAGNSSSEIRKLQHDLARRTGLAQDNGLTLRKATAEHLRTMTVNREYLSTRYDSEMTNASQVNRLVATLEEVATKVEKFIALTTITHATKRPS